MAIQLDGYSGTENVRIQIGPVYKGSAIRDSLSFIKFGDYKNQQQWAAVSQSINEVVAKDVIEPAKPESLQGKKVSFIGAFTVTTGSSDVIITPTMLEAQ